MLSNSIVLEKELIKLKLPVVKRKSEKVPTHHLWMSFTSANDAYEFYRKMESCGLMVNYRKLPYNLGMGIRMGTSAATLQGLNQENISMLASLIADIYYSKCVSSSLINKVQTYISNLVPITQTEERV